MRAQHCECTALMHTATPVEEVRTSSLSIFFNSIQPIQLLRIQFLRIQFLLIQLLLIQFLLIQFLLIQLLRNKQRTSD